LNVPLIKKAVPPQVSLEVVITLAARMTFLLGSI